MLLTIRFLHLLAVLVSAFSSISEAIRCFQCGSEAIFMDYYDGSNPVLRAHAEKMENIALTLESCENLENSFSWGMFAVDCAPDQVCMKTVIDDGFDENGKHYYVTGSRGCAMRNTSNGRIHGMECGILKTNVVPPPDTSQERWDLVCFCNMDYCNGVVSIYSTSIYTVLSIVIIIYLFKDF